MDKRRKYVGGRQGWVGEIIRDVTGKRDTEDEKTMEQKI